MEVEISHTAVLMWISGEDSKKNKQQQQKNDGGKVSF